MTRKELEKEAKQSYLNTTEETQWSEEGEIEYTRGYIDGAEPREKRITELENENAELERKLEQTEKDLADYQFNYSTIKELEKENTELKEKNRGLDAMLTGESLISNERKEQLTKAEEIIKLLLWDLRNHSYNPEKDMARAEEFLGRNK